MLIKSESPKSENPNNECLRHDLYNRKYDLRERTFRFSVRLVRFLNGLSISRVASPIINQLIRSGTSIGANVEEADSSPSRKDFKYKMIVSKKEAAETVYWIKIIMEAEILQKEGERNETRFLLDESGQILKILGSIVRKL